MLKSTLAYVLPLCSSIENTLEDFDGDASYLAGQSAELVVAFQSLATLLTLPTDPAQHRYVLDCIDESLAVLQAARSALMADVETRIGNGEDVAGFGFKAASISRSIPDYNLAVLALTALGLPQNRLYESKPLGVPAIEKLLKATGLKPDDRDAVLVQFVESKPGKAKLEKL